MRGSIILFIDELHTLRWRRRGRGRNRRVEHVEAALARGELRCVGAQPQSTNTKTH